MVQKGAKSARLMLDSELVYKQLTGEYRVKSPHITFLIKRIKTLMSDLTLEFNLVPREENRLANQLAQKASKKVKVKHQKFKQLPL